MLPVEMTSIPSVYIERARRSQSAAGLYTKSGDRHGRALLHSTLPPSKVAVKGMLWVKIVARGDKGTLLYCVGTARMVFNPMVMAWWGWILLRGLCECTLMG